MVFDGNRVVNLVLGRRDQDVFHHPAIADPDVAVTEVRPERMEQEIDRVGAANGHQAQLTHKEVERQSLRNADEQRHQ